MNLSILRERLREAKENEAQAHEHRLDIENQILAVISPKYEGTVKEAGISVVYKVTRKLDFEAYLAIEDGLPEGLKCVDMKPALNLKAFRALELVDPGLAATFVTESPAKPSISIIEEK